MNRPRKPIPAFAVFGPNGDLRTTRDTKADAEDAARVIGGTHWELHGFTIESVTVERAKASPSNHPDMIE
jgi:hypothetical protein